MAWHCNAQFLQNIFPLIAGLHLSVQLKEIYSQYLSDKISFLSSRWQKCIGFRLNLIALGGEERDFIENANEGLVFTSDMILELAGTKMVVDDAFNSGKTGTIDDLVSKGDDVAKVASKVDNLAVKGVDLELNYKSDWNDSQKIKCCFHEDFPIS